jgi:hypothetical protein
VAVCYVVAYAIGTLAPTPGGLGAIEGLLIALFVSFGVPSATAVTVVLVYRLINFWMPILPGLVAYVIVRPGRKPVAEGEIEEAAEEMCGAQPVAGIHEHRETAETPSAGVPSGREQAAPFAAEASAGGASASAETSASDSPPGGGNGKGRGRLLALPGKGRQPGDSPGAPASRRGADRGHSGHQPGEAGSSSR